MVETEDIDPLLDVLNSLPLVPKDSVLALDNKLTRSAKLFMFCVACTTAYSRLGKHDTNPVHNGTTIFATKPRRNEREKNDLEVNLIVRNELEGSGT